MSTGPILGGVYRHYKGSMYKVLKIAVHTETLEGMVIYKSLDDNLLWARPQKMFTSDVEIDGQPQKRFTYHHKEKNHRFR